MSGNFRLRSKLDLDEARVDIALPRRTWEQILALAAKLEQAPSRG